MDECKTTPPSTGVNGSAISPVSIDLDDKEGQDHPDADGAGRTRNPMVSFLVIASNHRAVEFALLSVVIVVVWGMLCLPVVFYHVTDSGSDSAEQQPAFEVVSGNETTFEVVCEEYPLEGKCYPYLLERQQCLMIDSTNVMVSPSPNAEGDLQTLEALLGIPIAQASQECKAAALPFTCLYLYSLCGVSGELYRPSAEECKHLSEEVCAQPWQFAGSFGMAGSLPNCDELVAETLQCGDGSTSGSGLNDTSLTPMISEEVTFTCRDDFSMVDGSVCMARCDSWEQSPHGQIVAVRVIVILAACIVLLAGCSVVILSCIRRKNMLVFPTVFLVYMCIGCCVIAFFVLVNYMDQDTLFCSEVTVPKAIDNSTPFCVLSGVVWQYCLLNITLCWLFHVSSIFWKVTFPFQARKYQPHQKYFHVVLGVASLLIPIPSIIAAFATKGYSIIRFPPLLCGVTDLNTQYYSLWLLLNIILGVGITLLIITAWKVHKHQGLFRAKFTTSGYTLNTAEKKLLFIFTYYIIFASVTLVYYSLTIRDTDKFVSAVERYFVCESLGHDSENPCPKDYEKYRYPIMEAVVYVLMAFIPTVGLVFVLQLRRVKKEIGRLSDRVQSKVVRSVRGSDHPDSALEALGRDSPILLKQTRLGHTPEAFEYEFGRDSSASQRDTDVISTPSPLSE